MALKLTLSSLQRSNRDFAKFERKVQAAISLFGSKEYYPLVIESASLDGVIVIHNNKKRLHKVTIHMNSLVELHFSLDGKWRKVAMKLVEATEDVYLLDMVHSRVGENIEGFEEWVDFYHHNKVKPAPQPIEVYEIKDEDILDPEVELSPAEEEMVIEVSVSSVEEAIALHELEKDQGVKKTKAKSGKKSKKTKTVKKAKKIDKKKKSEKVLDKKKNKKIPVKKKK